MAHGRHVRGIERRVGAEHDMRYQRTEEEELRQHAEEEEFHQHADALPDEDRRAAEALANRHIAEVNEAQDNNFLVILLRGLFVMLSIFLLIILFSAAVVGYIAAVAERVSTLSSVMLSVGPCMRRSFISGFYSHPDIWRSVLAFGCVFASVVKMGFFLFREPAALVRHKTTKWWLGYTLAARWSGIPLPTLLIFDNFAWSVSLVIASHILPGGPIHCSYL